MQDTTRASVNRSYNKIRVRRTDAKGLSRDNHLSDGLTVNENKNADSAI